MSRRRNALIVVAVMVMIGITITAITLSLDGRSPDECEKTPRAVADGLDQAPMVEPLPPWLDRSTAAGLIWDLLSDVEDCVDRDCLVPLIDASACLGKRLDVFLPETEGVCRLRALDGLPAVEVSVGERSVMLRTLALLHSSLPLSEIRPEAWRLADQLIELAEQSMGNDATPPKSDDCPP